VIYTLLLVLWPYISQLQRDTTPRPPRENLQIKAFDKKQSYITMKSMSSTCFVALLLASMAANGTAFSAQQRSRVPTANFAVKRSISMYIPSTSPTSQTPPMAGQKIQGSTPSKGNGKRSQARSKISMSSSVLASCDTLPSFPTAHGLLSPQTVMRMDELTLGSERSEALSLFLRTYRAKGPMSCLPMLSDPSILPHLTSALRDLA
jgi:hypothetical protein